MGERTRAETPPAASKHPASWDRETGTPVKRGAVYPPSLEGPGPEPKRASRGGGQSPAIQHALTPPETPGESVRTSVRCAVVEPSFTPSSALFGPMVTTVQPTTA